MALIRWQGTILKRFGQIANSLNCCCGCDPRLSICCNECQFAIFPEQYLLESMFPGGVSGTGTYFGDLGQYGAGTNGNGTSVTNFRFSTLSGEGGWGQSGKSWAIVSQTADKCQTFFCTWLIPCTYYWSGVPDESVKGTVVITFSDPEGAGYCSWHVYQPTGGFSINERHEVVLGDGVGVTFPAEAHNNCGGVHIDLGAEGDFHFDVG